MMLALEAVHGGALVFACLVALVCFVIAIFVPTLGRVSLVPLGLSVLTAVLLWNAIAAA